MGKSVNLEALKGHLFETLEGIKNQNDPTASECEKVQVDALKAVSHLDHMNSPANILIGMGVTGEDEVKAIS